MEPGQFACRFVTAFEVRSFAVVECEDAIWPASRFHDPADSLPVRDEPLWTATCSWDDREEIGGLGEGFAVFNAISQNAKRECLHTRYSIIARVAIDHDAGHFGDPPTVIFQLGLDSEIDSHVSSLPHGGTCDRPTGRMADAAPDRSERRLANQDVIQPESALYEEGRCALG